MAAVSPLEKRQYYYGGYYYSSPWAYWARWVVLGAILFLVLLFLIFAYCHARRRVSKNQPPLAYHAWMIPWRKRAHLYPQSTYNNQPNAYNQGYNLPQYQYNQPPVPPAPIYQQQGYWGQNNQPYQQPAYRDYANEANPPVGAPSKGL